MRRRGSFLRGVLVLALALLSLAAAPAPQAALLELWLNGRATGTVAEVTLSDSGIRVASADLAAIGFADPPPGLVDVAALPGVHAGVDAQNQRLMIGAPPALLAAQRYDLRDGAAAPEPQSDSGAVFRYDLSATMGDARLPRATTLGGADLGLDLFSPGALFSATGFLNGSAAAVQGARLDTSLSFDDPDRLRHLSFGDAINATPAFARAVRFGGVEYASDFSLRPGLVTQPLPSFFGQSAVPATVDVFSGAARLFEQQVAPGPFELNNLPVLTGGGSATIVTTDVLGRQTAQTISLFTDEGLLAPGLTDFSFDAGFLRRAYGLSSFDYGAPLASGNWREGLSDRLTLEAHGEASPHLGLVSGGGEIGLGWGSLGGDIAAGASRAGGGLLGSASLRALAGGVNLYAGLTAASTHYRDLASLDMGTPPPRLRWQAGATLPLAGLGTFGASFIDDREAGLPEHRYLSASWSRGLAGGMFASLAALEDFSSHAASVQLSLNLPLGRGAYAGVDLQSDQGRFSGTASYDAPADPDGGFGYRLLGGWDQGARLEGDAEEIGPHLAFNGGVSLADRQVSLRAGADGALVLLRGSLFAVHDPGEAVALVKTGDPGIRILRENRTVAVSDGNGEALLTGLAAYAPNHLGVEARDYGFDALVEKTEAVVAPRRHAGLVVDFTPASHHPLLALVTRGVPIATPVGARVTLDDGAPLVLGRDGELFVPELDKPMGATVELNGARCRIYIAPGAAMTRAAPLLCLREAQGAY